MPSALTSRCGPDGATTYAARPETEWQRFDRPDLAIVSKEAWRTAHARLTELGERFRKVGFHTSGRRRRDIESKYLLSGFTRCAQCGGAIGVLDRRQYGCIAYHKRGTTVCRNAVKLPIDALESAVLKKLSGDVLHPAAITALLDIVFKALAPESRTRDLARNGKELATIDRKIANLTTAIAEGGMLTPLLDALKAQQARREELTLAIAADAALDSVRLEGTRIERKVREHAAEWQALLTADVPRARIPARGSRRPAPADAQGPHVPV